MKFTGLLFFGVYGLSVSAFGFSDVCQLKDRAFATMPSSTASINSYNQKMTAECELSRRYTNIRETLQAKYQIGLEQISVYQAMRYIRRSDYAKAAYDNTPVQLIYQKLKSDYAKPNEQKSSEIWDNFSIGINQLRSKQALLAAGKKFDLAQLLAVHVGFYTVSDEKGDFTHEPFPGKLKIASTQDNPWWKLRTEEVAHTETTVSQLNNVYYEMGLLPDMVGGPYINQVLSVRSLDNGFAIYSADTRGGKMHVENILDFVDKMLDQARAGNPMVWNGRPMTPAELAYFVQQHFVGVHPLHEGNGRTSRFLQELILTSFNLPHGSSGDLMDSDVLTLHGPYYQLAQQKSMELLDTVQNCMNGAYKNLGGSAIESKDQNKISYECRLLKN